MRFRISFASSGILSVDRDESTAFASSITSAVWRWELVLRVTELRPWLAGLQRNSLAVNVGAASLSQPSSLTQCERRLQRRKGVRERRGNPGETRGQARRFLVLCLPMARLPRVVDCGCCSSRDAARKWSAIHFGQRRGAEGLSGFAPSGGASAGRVGGGLLPDVEPRAWGGDPAPARGAGGSVPPSAWALRLVLERCARLLRACVAGAVLFLPHGPRSPVDGPTLCRTESGARRNGGRGNGVALVQRRGALWSG